MINAILQGIISLVMGLVNIILYPIDALITTFLPDLSSGLAAINNMLNLVINVFGWVVDMTGLSKGCLSLIVLYFTFLLTAPLAVSTVKLALKWYKALKL